MKPHARGEELWLLGNSLELTFCVCEPLLAAFASNSLQLQLCQHPLELLELFCSHIHTHTDPEVPGHLCPLGRLSMIMTDWSSCRSLNAQLICLQLGTNSEVELTLQSSPTGQGRAD